MNSNDVRVLLNDVRQSIDWRLLLIPPLAILASLPLSHFDNFYQGLQGWLEGPAPLIVGAASLVYFLRAGLARQHLSLVLAVLAAAMAMREGRTWTGLGFMTKGVYVAAGAVAVWSCFWRRQLRQDLRSDRRHAAWLAATFVAYFLAVLIGRRAFRFIPGEHHIHRSLEEWAETVAHMMFVTTSLLAAWRKPRHAPPPSKATARLDKETVQV